MHLIVACSKVKLVLQVWPSVVWRVLDIYIIVQDRRGLRVPRWPWKVLQLQEVECYYHHTSSALRKSYQMGTWRVGSALLLGGTIFPIKVYNYSVKMLSLKASAIFPIKVYYYSMKNLSMKAIAILLWVYTMFIIECIKILWYDKFIIII